MKYFSHVAKTFWSFFSMSSLRQFNLKGVVLFLIGILLIFYAGRESYYSLKGAFNQNFIPDKNLAYAVTTPNHLAVIDTRTDQITKKIDIKSDSHLNPTLDIKGNVYLSHYKQLLEMPGNDIIIYNPALDRVIRLDSHGEGPTSMVPFMLNGRSKLFVANYISKEIGRNTSSIAIFKGENHQFEKTLLVNMYHSIFYSMIASWHGDRIYALAENLDLGKEMYKNYLYIIDPVAEKITAKIFLPGGGSRGRIVETKEGKIYTGPGFTTTGQSQNIDGPPAANYLCVYDNRTFTLLKKIPLSANIPIAMIYYPNLDKLYVQSSYGFHIDVIDTKTDKLIKTMVVEGADGIYRVSKDKLYINIVPVPAEQRGFKILDANTDEIVGFIPGKFGGVSDIPLEWVMDSH